MSRKMRNRFVTASMMNSSIATCWSASTPVVAPCEGRLPSRRATSGGSLYLNEIYDPLSMSPIVTAQRTPNETAIIRAIIVSLTASLIPPP